MVAIQSQASQECKWLGVAAHASVSRTETAAEGEAPALASCELGEPFYGLRHWSYNALGRRRWRRAMTQEIRWQQRFSNYRKALAQLETFLQPPALNEREQQGLIKAFEYTFELAWNTLRDLLRSQGDASLLGSRDTLREAFRLGLIEDGEAWMLMIQDRNLTSHTYNRSTADAIAANIVESYLPCFQQLSTRLEQRQLQEG